MQDLWIIAIMAATTTKIRIISVATDLMTISIRKVVRAKVITWAIAEITTTTITTICNNGMTIAKMVVASRTNADDSKCNDRATVSVDTRIYIHTYIHTQNNSTNTYGLPKPYVQNQNTTNVS